MKEQSVESYVHAIYKKQKLFFLNFIDIQILRQFVCFQGWRKYKVFDDSFFRQTSIEQVKEIFNLKFIFWNDINKSKLSFQALLAYHGNHYNNGKHNTQFHT